MTFATTPEPVVVHAGELQVLFLTLKPSIRPSHHIFSQPVMHSDLFERSATRFHQSN
jgi:hypothetical protein